MWFGVGLGWFEGGLVCFEVVWGVSTDPSQTSEDIILCFKIVSVEILF